MVGPSSIPVAGARVTLSAGGHSLSVNTDAAGRFKVVRDGLQGTAELRVNANGFAPFQTAVDLSRAELGVFTLVLEAKSEEVIVTAGRWAGRLGDTAASVTVLDSTDLSTTAALAIDDALRQVPGFSLFRRTGSRTANPTSQGVSLRGVGASGASRAVVLLDGVPMSDPFGGWIYWTSIPRLSLDRVEVVRGGGSSLYGSDALGGVVSLVPRPDDDHPLALEGSFGTTETATGSLFAGARVGGMGVRLSADASRTDGDFIVDQTQRGAVDTRAGADYGTASLVVDRKWGDSSRSFLRGSYFSEKRNNGTALQVNDTRTRSLAGGADFRASKNALSFRVFGGSEVYNQTFTSIVATRATETLIRTQRTPSHNFGFTSQASRATGRHTLVAGVDVRVVRGFTNENAITAGRATSRVDAGGEERSQGVFFQDTIAVRSRLLLTVGGRFDAWNHTDGRSITTTLATGALSGGAFKARGENAFDPRLALLYRLRPSVSLTASAYRGFRAPTLNELYRSFRVGNVSTQSNAALRAENLTGAEGGLSVEAFERRLHGRANLFLSRIEDPIVNATLSVTPDLTTRQRQNLGANRSNGFEAEVQIDIARSLSLSTSYLFLRARVSDAPGNPAVQGRDLPQVPRHQGTLQLRYAATRGTKVALQARASGSQFDDDQNLLPLSAYKVVDVFASAPLAHRLELFIAVENALSERYETGRAGVTTIGSPRAARVGLRFDGR